MNKVVAKKVLEIIAEATEYDHDLGNLAMFLNYTTKSDKLSKEDACYCNVVKKMPFDKLITSMLMLTGNLPIIELEEQFMPAVILHIAGSTAIADSYVTELEIYNPITDTIRSPKMYKISKIVEEVRRRMGNNSIYGTTDLGKSMCINDIVEELNLEKFCIKGEFLDSSTEDWAFYSANTSKYFDKEGYKPTLKELVKVLVQREILNIK